MRPILTVVLIYFSFTQSSWACMGQNQAERISPIKNNIAEIEFSLNHFGRQEKVVLQDDDGMATATILYYGLIQDLSDDLYQQKVDWENIKNKPVKNWNIVGQRIISSLERVANNYELWAKDPQNANAYHTLETQVQAVLPQLKGQTVSYAQLSSLGKFLENAARLHTYNVSVYNLNTEQTTVKKYPLVENNSQNPIGSLLMSRSLTLPPTWMSRCGDYVHYDLQTILSSEPDVHSENKHQSTANEASIQ